MFFLYHQQLQPKSNLIEGRLLLVDSELPKIKNTYIAASGLPNNQTFEALSYRGRGAIPPNNIAEINNYSVSTAPIYMPQIRGVEGNFYKINPHQIKISGVERADFGIHFDANVPGSSGCIVLRTDTGWSGFEADMKNLLAQGIKQIPLLVSYSR